MHGKHILLLRTKFIEVYSKKKFWIFEKLKEEGKTVANCYVHDSGIIQNREVVEMIVSDDAKVVDYLEIFTEYEKNRNI